MNKRCPTCGRDMRPLFTSQYCDICDNTSLDWLNEALVELEKEEENCYIELDLEDLLD